MILDRDDVSPSWWRFYKYGEDDNGEPLFSFWMGIDEETGVCLYERNTGAGNWLSTEYNDIEYDSMEPSEELKDALRDVFVGDGEGVSGERVHSLPDHERYFFQIIHGSIEQKGRVPDELMVFLSDICDTPLEIVED